jgi:hypothetical protein
MSPSQRARPRGIRGADPHIHAVLLDRQAWGARRRLHRPHRPADRGAARRDGRDCRRSQSPDRRVPGFSRDGGSWSAQTAGPTATAASSAHTRTPPRPTRASWNLSQVALLLRRLEPGHLLDTLLGRSCNVLETPRQRSDDKFPVRGLLAAGPSTGPADLVPLPSRA